MYTIARRICDSKFSGNVHAGARFLCSCTLKRIEEIHIIENAGFSVRQIKADWQFVIARQAHFPDSNFLEKV